MAIQKNGVFGAWSGKCGTLVGSRIYGQATFRTHQPNILNPRSAGQVGQRTAFKVCNYLGVAINSPLLIPLMKRFTKGMSQLNKFTSLNVSAFSSEGVLTYASLVISFGKLIAPIVASCEGLTTKIVVELTPNVDSFALPTDKLYLLLIDSVVDDNGNYPVIFAGDTGYVRSDMSVSKQLDVDTTVTATMKAYFSYLRVDGSIVSNSAFSAVEV